MTGELTDEPFDLGTLQPRGIGCETSWRRDIFPIQRYLAVRTGYRRRQRLASSTSHAKLESTGEAVL